MRQFEEALVEILLNGLVAQAGREGFTIEDPAARFYAQRALGNIKRRAPEPRDQLRDVLAAIDTAPEFLARIDSQFGQRSIFTEDSALNLVPTKDCVYPWCRW